LASARHRRWRHNQQSTKIVGSKGIGNGDDDSDNDEDKNEGDGGGGGGGGGGSGGSLAAERRRWRLKRGGGRESRCRGRKTSSIFEVVRLT
jgi:hypothetical protein